MSLAERWTSLFERHLGQIDASMQCARRQKQRHRALCVGESSNGDGQTKRKEKTTTIDRLVVFFLCVISSSFERFSFSALDKLTLVAMQLQIKTLANEKFTIECELTDTVKSVKEKIAAAPNLKDKYEANAVKLIYSGKILEDALTLESYSINQESFLVVVKQAAPKASTVKLRSERLFFLANLRSSFSQRHQHQHQRQQRRRRGSIDRLAPFISLLCDFQSTGRSTSCTRNGRCCPRPTGAFSHWNKSNSLTRIIFVTGNARKGAERIDGHGFRTFTSRISVTSQFLSRRTRGRLFTFGRKKTKGKTFSTVRL